MIGWVRRRNCEDGLVVGSHSARETQSPGGPYGTVTIEKFSDAGILGYRNPNVSEALKVLGYVQRFGVGLPRQGGSWS